MPSLPIQYSLRLYSASGTLIDELMSGRTNDALRVEYARTQGDIGVMSVELPSTYPAEWFTQDNYFEIIRLVDGVPGGIEMETRWSIVKRRKNIKGGLRSWVITALDTMSYLKWRTVAHYKGDPQSKKTGVKTDDLLKAIMRENALSTSFAYSNTGSLATIPPLRNIVGLVIDPDTAQGVAIDYEMQHKRILDVMKDVAKLSQEKGTWLGYDVIWNGANLVFKTFTGQRGSDRRGWLILRPGYGLGDVSLEIDWSESFTAVFSGGETSGGARNVAVAFDKDRAAQTPYGWREVFQDAKDKSGLTYLEADATARLRDGRPKYTMIATITQDDGPVYGRDYQYGDLMIVDIDGELMDARVAGVRVVLEGGNEAVTVAFNDSGAIGNSNAVWTHMLANPAESAIFSTLQRINQLEYLLRRVEATE
jgi:hypothetical protein